MFDNNLLLCKLILRRDWLRIVLWLVAMATLVVGFGASMSDVIDTSAEGMASMLGMMQNPAMVAMMGPLYLTEDGAITLGSFYATFMLVWSAMFMAVMNIFHVVRHTRHDEEQGRIEVIRSLPVGRMANLSATLTTALLVNVAFALILGGSLGAVGTEGMGMEGGLLFGALIGAAGLAFAVITAVFCQLSANPRTAQALAFATLVVMYGLRGYADLRDVPALNIISPLGLIFQAKNYVEDNWWPVALSLGFSLLIAIVAFMLCGARDMGAGLIPARPGQRDAAPYLRSPAGLAWRLLKTPFIIWAVSITALSVSYGSIMGDIEDFMQSIPALLELSGGDSLILVSFFMIIMAMMAAIPMLQFFLKARGQESGGFAENVLARAASRYSQLAGYFVLALAAAVFMQLFNCVGFWLSCLAVMEDPIPFGDLFAACMIYTPALLFMLGLAMILNAYLPKRTAFVWFYLGYAFAVIYMGAMIGLPEWLAKLTPFGHIPQLPTEEVTGERLAVLVGMCLASLVMYVVGFVGYRQRDMS
ncbi:MAG: hypothetical protein LBI54_08965 [Lachnospiraceae bacterium]|jgi:ABC-2 type transport system permease protein|nr:hypothetical protein [Lachnospiraceae bacterium]